MPFSASRAAIFAAPLTLVLAGAAVAQMTPAVPATTAAPSPTATPATGPATAKPAPAATAPAKAATPATTAAPAATPTPTATAAAPATSTAPNPMVGGAAMDAAQPIAVNAAAAPNLSTLVAAVKAADLGATLSGPGPFTVFAPTNDAFGRLPKATVDSLMAPANKATLAKVLKYHVVPGTITLADITAKTANGTVLTLTTVEGEPLTVKSANGAVELTDVNGNKSYVETADVRQSNGVVHVVNGVLVPKL